MRRKKSPRVGLPCMTLFAAATGVLFLLVSRPDARAFQSEPQPVPQRPGGRMEINESAPFELQLRIGARLEEKGDLEGALRFYGELEKKFPGEEATVHAMGRVLFRMGKLDEAEGLFLRERTARADSVVFGMDLEMVHRAQRRFGVAILDCIDVLRNEITAYDWARSELLAISRERETFPVITEELRRFREDEKSGGLMSALLAEMYLRAAVATSRSDEYSGGRAQGVERAPVPRAFLRAAMDSVALAEAIHSDEKSGGDGGRLFQFATLAKALGRSETALLALGEIEKRYGMTPISRQASVFALEITLDTGNREEAVKKLQTLALNDAVPYLSRAAKVRLAGLLLDDLADYPKSSDLISTLVSQPGNDRPRLLVMLSRCYMGMGEFERADSLLAGILESHDYSSRDEALFRRANISFYAGRLDEAVERYFSIAVELPGTVFSNDGLDMAMLIDENREDAGGLSRLSKALLFAEVGKRDSSIVLLESAADESLKTSLGEHIICELASLYDEKGESEKAYHAYLKVGEAEPGGRLSPFALKMAGGIKERLLDFSTASALYEKAILKYPDSVVVPELRDRLNEIRKKARS